MNLKKAFQFQKAIDSLQYNIVNEALEKEKFQKVVENHKRSELNYYFNYAVNNYKDEQKVKKSKNLKNYEFRKLMELYNFLTECRVKLAGAISHTKDQIRIGEEGLTYDAAVVKSNDFRYVLSYYETLSNMEEVESESKEYITFNNGTEKLQASYTVVTTTKPDKEVVELARQEYFRIKELTNDLSDAIEAAAITSRIDDKAIPGFPVTADLDYLYEHYEKLVK